MRNLMLAFIFALTADSVMAQSDTESQSASQPEASPEDTSRFLVVPLVGVRSGGSFTAVEQELALEVNSSLGFGLIFDYKLTRTSRLEFLWSSQRSDFDVISVAPVGAPGEPPAETPQFDIGINYFHGAYVYGGGTPRFQPYVAVGAGLATFCPAVADSSVQTKFSFSLGTGFRSFLTERIGVLIDARAFGTRIGDRREDVTCGVFGCVSFETAATFWQGQLLLGLVVAF
jgi:hypothetical protein